MRSRLRRACSHTAICALLGALVAAALQAPGPASAQRRPRAAEAEEETQETEAPGPQGGLTRRTGFELELHGSQRAWVGRPYVLRGTAFEVLGLATLHPLPRARVELFGYTPRGVRESQSLVQATSDDAGRFTLTLPSPRDRVAVVLGQGDQQRVVDLHVQLQHRELVELLTDRRLYEPGETAHLWARLTDRSSGAPLVNIAGRLNVFDPRGRSVLERPVRSSDAGLVTADVPLGAGVPDGLLTARLELVTGQTVSAQAQVGRRTVERLQAEVRLEQRVLAPGARLRGTVLARTPSGSPVREAAVTVVLGQGADNTLHLRTDREGVARFEGHAPLYAPEAISGQTVSAEVVHPAHGSIRAVASYTVARTPLSAEAVVAAGGLVPEVQSPVYVALRDPTGNPPPEGTEVELLGPGLPQGRARARADRWGFAELRVRLPEGSAATHTGGACDGRAAASFDVNVLSTPPLSTRVCLPVSAEAQVLPSFARPAYAPGETVVVQLERRPSVASRAVVVDLLHQSPSGGQGVLLASRRAAPGASRVEFTLPGDLLGLVHARARPEDGHGAAEGTGALAAAVVRPAQAFALQLEPEAQRYLVRQRAALRVRSPAGLQGGHVAFVVRDLSAHGGEVPFALRWLGGAVDTSLADPAQPEAERLLRSALAAHLEADPQREVAPPLPSPQHPEEGSYEEGNAVQRGDLRDPFALRDELLRRGLRPALQALENAVAEAAQGSDSRAVVRQGRWHFAPDVIHVLAANGNLSEAVTLGGGEMTLAMLQAAVPEFTFDRAARRVARPQLVHLLASLANFVDPPEGVRSPVATEPPERWLSRMVDTHLVEAQALRDPWGGRFVLRRATGSDTVAFAVRAAGWELVSPGPDGVAGNGDDVRNPFERVVPEGTQYALASGEDELLRRLAALDPGREVLGQLQAAFARVGSGTAEENTGEVASAQSSEGLGLTGTGLGGGGTGEGTIGLGNIGTIGRGGGGGSGQGYGSGAGRGLAGRSAGAVMESSVGDAFGYGGLARQAAPAGAAAPVMQQSARDADDQTRGRRSAQGPRTMGALVGLLRERFPATLHFVATQALDPSGTTRVEVPLQDALTTYRVDAIAWTASGWTTSASAQFQVDQDAVVDAPVPPVAVVGERLRLPVRVSNRSDHPLRLRVTARADGELAARVGAGDEVSLEAGEAREVPVEVTLEREGRGALLVSVQQAAGDQAVLDSVRRPLEVQADLRPVRAAAELLVQGHGTLQMVIPQDARARAPGALRVVLGEAVFRRWIEVQERGPDPEVWARREVVLDVSSGLWRHWARALGNPDELSLAALAREYGAVGPLWERDPDGRVVGAWLEQVARSVGVLWRAPSVSDATVQRGVEVLLEALRAYRPRPGWTGPYSAEEYARALLGLVPAVAHAQERPALAARLAEVTRSLRGRVEASTPLLSEDFEVFARAAAALLLTDAVPSPRTQELLRRLERILRPVEGSTAEEVALERSALGAAYWGLLRLAQGERGRAFEVARGLLTRLGGRSSPGPEAGAVVPALLSRLTAGGRAPERVQLVVDGVPQELVLRDGAAGLPLPRLSEPGEHRVELRVAGDAVLLAVAEARYGRSWSAPTGPRGPLAVELLGEVGARDSRAGLTLRVQNRSARVVAAPVLELALPAGAELDEPTRQDLARRLGQPIQLTGRVLALRLRAMAPGGFVRLPLAVRWSVGGSLRGLGVAAYASGEVGAAVSVLPPPASVEVPDAPAAQGGEVRQ